MGLIEDVSEQLKSLDLTVKALRKFALTVGAVLFIIAGVLYFRKTSYGPGSPYVWTLAAAAALLVFFGLTLPSSLKWVYRRWMLAAFIMGWFVSRIILFLLYYMVITPIGLIAKLSGRDFLELKIDRQADSYWSVRDKKVSSDAELNVSGSGKHNRARYEKMY
jgi:hypothetical protein